MSPAKDKKPSPHKVLTKKLCGGKRRRVLEELDGVDMADQESMVYRQYMSDTPSESSDDENGGRDESHEKSTPVKRSK